MIERALYKSLQKDLNKQKVTVLLGARRVGKTELLRQLASEYPEQTLFLNGEDESVDEILDRRTKKNYTRLLEGKRLLIIDEAQYIKDIGKKVKLMIDEIKPLHIIITGSSAFEISQNALEPLVGRTITRMLYPIAQLELSRNENPLQTKDNLADRLIFGSYPELLNLESREEKVKYLSELVNVYMLKDILAFENVRNPQKLKDLLQLIAHQTGSEVSLDEVGRKLQISKNTVEKYLDLLGKSFILYKRTGYSRNLRKEVTKSSKWYFYDNGIRNALINQFGLLPSRADIGQLWENYVLSERLKKNNYNESGSNSYFWRTYDQQEIDLVEENEGSLNGYEMKWKETASKVPTAFAKNYPNAGFDTIHSENYEAFIT